jgi:hypothetical protein
MWRCTLALIAIAVPSALQGQAHDYLSQPYGDLLPDSCEQAGLWWASSGWKISRERELPSAKGEAMVIRAAKNETEAAQFAIRPAAAFEELWIKADTLVGPGGAKITPENIEVLEVRYVSVTRPTDKSAVAGHWPDPLLPVNWPIGLDAGKNQPFWVRVTVPRDAQAGLYRGKILISARASLGGGWLAAVPIEVEVYDFVLPDRMTCTTSFGFSPDDVFRYQGLKTNGQKREVLEKYWADFSAHHISPYYPVPLDGIRVTWPDIRPSEGKREGGGFETSDLAKADRDRLKVKLDFSAWDQAMQRAIDQYHFNSFLVSIPGLGGGSFHNRSEPELLGFTEDTPQYRLLFDSYCSQLQEHLRDKGWLDEAYVYWFDEPELKDYAFVMNGFAKLRAAAPGIGRMLTEQVEPALVGGPNIWCPASYLYEDGPAQQRRELGEKFWWYVCTGPKAPYCTLFIDHPATELRVWLWQTRQRKIDGILVWQTNYWTSSAAYPDPEHPQNPYEDPMGWTSGYGIPAGQELPWGNGDGRFIYPPLAAADAHPGEPVLEGPVDSIRWEMLRDGIEDYEYLATLRRLIETRADRLSEAQRQEYIALLEVPAEITSDMTTFTKDPAAIEAHRDRLARAIAALQNLP